ncbi:MAG: hypothetical protein PHU17_01995 [Candidatus Pacebacteria bacterium]|nr:hypothetical protein [Candidatus Paceibacterota bacterium]
MLILSLFLVGNVYAGSKQSGQQQNINQPEEQLMVNQTGNQPQTGQGANQGGFQIGEPEFQGEDSQGQSQDNGNGIQNRSQVANAVQTMLRIAENNSGIGEQIRIIAQTQLRNQEQIDAKLERIKNRNSITKFLIGADYTSVNDIEKILEENEDKINQLEEIKGQLNEEDLQVLNEQIEKIEEVSLEIQNTLESSQKGFSLLGWLFKIIKA